MLVVFRLLGKEIFSAVISAFLIEAALLREVHISMCFYDLLVLILHSIHFRILCNLWICIFVHSELTEGHQCHSSITVIISHSTRRRHECTPRVHWAHWYWRRQMLNFSTDVKLIFKMTFTNYFPTSNVQESLCPQTIFHSLDFIVLNRYQCCHLVLAFISAT